MDISTPVTATERLSQLDDTTFLLNITIALSVDDDIANELDSPSTELTRLEPDISPDVPLAGYPYFQATRLTLRYLLGNDTDFPGNLDSPSPKLLLLYDSASTHALVASVLNVAQSAVEPGLVHAFFARMAWIDESSVTTPLAKAQLEHLLYRISPLSNEARLLGAGDFSELGQLLSSVPEDLRMWMLQFKHGLRWKPASEWLTHCPVETLQQGLVRHEKTQQQSALTILATVIERLLPTAGQFQDEPLATSLTMRLASPLTQQLIEATVQAIYPAPAIADSLRLEWGSTLDNSVRRQFFQKLALHALNSNDEPWVRLALDNARSAPGMQAFSFATLLAQKHPTLSTECCLRLGSLWLPEPVEQASAELEPLSNAQVLSPELPAFTDWCPVSSIDDLFKRVGMELLCEFKDGKHHLRLPAWETWQAMMQSSNFATLFQPLLRKLGWYGARPGEAASPRATQALGARAITEHFLGPWDQSAQSIERSFRDNWVTEFSHAQLRQELTRAIAERNPNISPASLSMLEYLLLREIAPELLVADVPDWLYYGRSLQSVALIQGARLLEAISPGAACRAGSDQVVMLARDLSTSEDATVQRLWSQTLVLPALRYAMAHGAIDALAENDIQNATHQQIEAALSFLKAEQQSLAQAAVGLNGKTPDRKTLAEKQLRLAGVDSYYWDKGIGGHETWAYLESCGLEKASSYAWNHTLASPGAANDVGAPNERPIIMSLLQLVMMGQINRAGETTVPQLYDDAFTTFCDSWQSTHAKLIKRLFKELPASYRTQLHASTCEVSLVKFAEEEGYQGLFIRCQSGDHQSDFDQHQATNEYYFEIVPSAGAARKCRQGFEYVFIPTSGFHGNLADLYANQIEKQVREQQGRIKPLLPFDSDAYLKGTPSRSSQDLHTPLKGELVPAAESVYGADSSEDAFLQSLAEAAAKHLYATPLAKLKIEHTHTTTWEEVIAQDKKIVDCVARLVLPFYGCIKDLADSDRSTGVIVGCVLDAATALIPLGQFIGASAKIAIVAGELTIRSACEEMSAALSELVVELAQQSPLLLFRDLSRAAIWLSTKAWEELAQSATWLKALIKNKPFLHVTESGTYTMPLEAFHDWQASNPLDDLVTVDKSENSLVRNLGTEKNPGNRLLDSYSDRPYGPALTEAEASQGASLTALHATHSITPPIYPGRVLYELSEDGVISIKVPEECAVRVRYKGQGQYDLSIDDHLYRLDTTRNDSSLIRLSDSRISESSTLTEEDVICRRTRDLIEDLACVAYTKLTSVPIEQLPPVPGEQLTLGKEVSLAFESREFHLDRRTIAATGQAPERTLNVLVHEGKFCKWDHEVIPAKGRRPAKTSSQRKILVLSPEERSSLGLPSEPGYLPEITGRMSTQRKFGLTKDLSGNEAKRINPFVPVVELDQVTAEIADKRILRGISHSLNGQKVVYVEADTGQIYKAIQGPDLLTFSRVTDRLEINEYLRLSEQYRFVAERPYSLKDRENIAKLLFDVAVQKQNHGIEAWLAQAPANRQYATYVQWCIDNNEENQLLHFAENILSGEDAQMNLVEETRSIIPDWEKLAERSGANQLHTAGILNNLLPAQGKEALWTPLKLSQADTTELIGKQLAGGNLAYASIRTKAGERYVYYALSGGKQTKGIRLKPYVQGLNSRTMGGVTYVDAGALMKNRSPDPDFTSLPVVRHADKLTVSTFDRYLDSERLIATVVKENFHGQELEHIKIFTRWDTCRSCGGVVLPQLKLAFPDTDFSVTYLQEYVV
ncbi:deaminase domain-containing protein [Pseudomonas akapageensis]|uniref:deaminase domain-containing protein n=1 Tax=Pseudomonas akapageensis TaxID=2609961 RepID=UPI00140E2AAF|nr:deaminase domain-containing protein [Pseudomonas akapageensis]